MQSNSVICMHCNSFAGLHAIACAAHAGLPTPQCVQDMLSGSCTPRPAPPTDGNGNPTSTEGGHGRTPSAAQRREMRQCSFRSPEGLELADSLQCQVRLSARLAARFLVTLAPLMFGKL